VLGHGWLDWSNVANKAAIHIKNELVKASKRRSHRGTAIVSVHTSYE